MNGLKLEMEDGDQIDAFLQQVSAFTLLPIQVLTPDFVSWVDVSDNHSAISDTPFLTFALCFYVFSLSRHIITILVWNRNIIYGYTTLN